MNNFPEVLTPKQACEYAQVSRWTLQRWERQGLPVARVGGVVRVFRADIDRFLQAHRLRQADMLCSNSSARTELERQR